MPNDNAPSTDPLQSNLVDHTVTGLKTLVNAIPWVGGSIAEILGHVIPGQRLDRVVRFVIELDARLAQVEVRPGLAEDARFVDLFEDATLQALRALSEQRTNQLVHFLVQAASEGEPGFDVDKRLLQILAELTDTEVEILRSHMGLEWTRVQQRFYFEPLAYGPYQVLSDADKNAHDARRVAWDLHVHALQRLGLLRGEVREIGPMRGTFDIDENTGLPRIDSYRITTLGQLLLRRIGEVEPKPASDP